MELKLFKTTKSIIDREHSFIMQTYKRQDIVIDHGKGCYLYDSEGKRYLDLVGSLATAPLGYGNEEFAKTLEGQAQKLINATNLYYTQEQVTLAEKLAKISGLDKCFFVNSGSEAVEVAIKLARKHTKKTDFIATENAFHGRTFAALTATWNKKYKDAFKPLVPGFIHVKYNDAAAIENAINEKTSAVIVEPIQGESGILVPDRGYLKKVNEICKKHDVLLVLDEVQTNMRTGSFFAYQHDNILPGIVTIAKGIANGIPMGAVIAKEDVARSFEKGDQGSTFGGNSLACVAALKTIEIVERNKLIENAAKMGEYFIKKLNEMNKVKKSVKEVRGKGLMIGIELNGKSSEIEKLCLEKGLLVNCANETTLRLLPPLVISKKEIDEALKVFGEVFS